MKTRSGGFIDYDQLWLGLFEAINTSSDAIIGHVEAFESIVLKKKEYIKDFNSYKISFQKNYLPFPLISPFILDKREEKTGDTLLISAARQQNFPIVKRLIKDGAFVHIKNNENQTALYQAVNNDHVEMATFLLSQGATFAEIGLNTLYSLLSRTGIHTIDWLRLLDKCQMDVTKQDHNGYRLMDHVVRARNFPLIDLLLVRKIPFPTKQILNEFKTSSCEFQTLWVDFSIEHKVNLDSVSDDKYTALYYCASKNNVPGVRKLLEAKASIKLPSMDFFPYDDDHFKMAELLSEYKFPLDGPKFFKLIGIAKLPVESVMNWTKICASNYNKSSVLDLVLSRRADLHDMASVEALLQKGANPNIKYDAYASFNKPMDSAISNKNLPMIKLLISKGAVADPQAIMQLMYKDGFVVRECIDLMLLLKEKNPSLNITSIRHNLLLDTPLITAAYINNLDNLLCLLNFSDNISVNLEDKEKKSALDYGIKERNIKIIHALLSHGATFNKNQENNIYAIILTQIFSGDLSIKYAAISCLNILYLQTNKEEYKRQLEQHEKLIADVVTDAMPKDGFKNPNRLISEYLFFHSKPLKDKKEETSLKEKKATSPLI